MDRARLMRTTTKRRAGWGLALAAVALLATGCGSDNSASSSASGTTVALADCPFSGTTANTSGSGAASSSVSKVATSKSGCIDNIAFEFSTVPPSWTVAYSDGPFVDASTNAPVSVPGPATLVVTFAGTTYGAGKTPSTVAPTDLDYVSGINVITGPDNSVQWILSVPQKAQYATSVSNVPSNFQIAIG